MDKGGAGEPANPVYDAPDFIAADEQPAEAAPQTVDLGDDPLAIPGEESSEAQAPGDIWDRIRAGFEFDRYDHPRIDKELAWFARHPGYMDRVADRAAPYMHYIVESIEARGIPMEIALLPIVESAFQPFAYSHGRASGIWQFIPATGRRYGLKQTWWYDGRRDVYAATQAALDFLEDLHRQFKGDWTHALAAYNSGGGTVRSAIRRNKKRGKPTDFFSLDLPKETRGYVPKLLALKRLVADPAAYNLTLKPIADQPYFARVEIGSQLDLALAAKLAELDIDTVYRLNPAFNHWATDPAGPHYLLLPLDKAGDFSKRLEELPESERVSWKRHRIREGEALSTIARKYGTTVYTIKRANKLRGTNIRAGRSLLIPVASKPRGSYALSAEQRKRQTQSVPRSGAKRVHVVRSGDTLWDIAQRHGVGVRQLAKWNSMAPRDPLRPGQRLVIWSKTGAAVSSAGTTDLLPPPSRKITQRIGYRVRPGDSLSRISSRFNVTVSQLRRWNSLPKGKYLQPGQRLVVYVDVTRQSG